MKKKIKKQSKRRPARKRARKLVKIHRKINARKKHIFTMKARVSKMSKRKKSRKARRMHGFDGLAARRQVVVMGAKRRHGRRRSRGLLMGGEGLVSKMGGNALNVAAGIAGGIGGAFVANMIPVSGKPKVIIPLIGGLALASATKIQALRFAGLGISIMAGLALVKQMLPAVPLMGDPVMLGYMPEPAALPDMIDMGDPVDLTVSGWATQANT